jgi:PAS domain S-box-containing protein
MFSVERLASSAGEAAGRLGPLVLATIAVVVAVILAQRSSDRARRLDDANDRLSQEALERRRMQESLRESERKLRLITETVEDVFWMATPGIDEILHISPTYETLWGRSCRSLRESPRSFLDAIHADDRPGVERTLLEHARLGKRWDLEYRIRHPSGAIRWIRDRGYPVFDRSGSLSCLTGAASDITEVKVEQGEREPSDQLSRVG